MIFDEPMEFTMKIEDADLEVIAKVFKDIKIPDCPYFDITDKYGNEARYYRENGWTPITKRLPEINGTYIVSYEDVSVPMDWFNGHWFFYRTNPAIEEMGTITAWQPLPESYKKEGGKK